MSFEVLMLYLIVKIDSYGWIAIADGENTNDMVCNNK